MDSQGFIPELKVHIINQLKKVSNMTGLDCLKSRDFELTIKLMQWNCQASARARTESKPKL